MNPPRKNPAAVSERLDPSIWFLSQLIRHFYYSVWNWRCLILLALHAKKGTCIFKNFFTCSWVVFSSSNLGTVANYWCLPSVNCYTCRFFVLYLLYLDILVALYVVLQAMASSGRFSKNSGLIGLQFYTPIKHNTSVQEMFLQWFASGHALKYKIADSVKVYYILV